MKGKITKMVAISVDLTVEEIAQLRFNHTLQSKLLAACDATTNGKATTTKAKATKTPVAEPVEDDAEDDDTAERRTELEAMTLKDLKTEALDLGAAEKAELVGAKKADLVELILAAELEDDDSDSDEDADDEDADGDDDDDDTDDDEDVPDRDEIEAMGIRELRNYVRENYADDAKEEGLNIGKASKDELVEFIFADEEDGDDDEDEDEADEDDDDADDEADDEDTDDSDGDSDDDEDDDEVELTEEDLEKMSVGELRKLVKQFNGKWTPKDNKEALIKKIIDLSEVPF